jgi:hypothetical protein
LTNHIPNTSSSLALSALYQLVSDNFIIKESSGLSTYFVINGQGFNLKNKGGYEPYLKELKAKYELQDNVNTSVIDTNDLVRQNVRTQQRLTKYALTIAFFAALFPAITLVKEFLRPQQLIDKGTQLILKKQQESIQHLQQNLDSINASLKNLKTISYKIDTTKN